MVAFTPSTIISALAIFATSVNALPQPPPPSPPSPPPPPPGRPGPPYEAAKDLSKLATFMPQSTLPAPVGDLKYVVLGVGTQNYTCATSDDTTKPVAIGATAKLYDIGTPLNRDPLVQWKIPTISGLALALSTQDSIFEFSLLSQGYEHLLGHHFFAKVPALNGANTPTFAFDQLPGSPYPMAQVSKLNQTDAPKWACPGLASEGAVPWLYLKDNSGVSKGGVDTVYRLETAGGSAPASCKGAQAAFQVPYTAQYWVFGPK